MTYKDQYLDIRWQQVRLERLEASRWHCDDCGCGEEDADDNETLTLHVHHKRYFKNRKVWEYRLDDLETLCEHCHGNFHASKEIIETLLTLVYHREAVSLLAGYLMGNEGVSNEITDAAFHADPLVFMAGDLARIITSLDVYEIKQAEQYIMSIKANRTPKQTFKEYTESLKKTT